MSLRSALRFARTTKSIAYKTPIGAKVVTEMPQIMTEAMQASMHLTSQRLGSLIENMTREMLANPAAASPK